MSIPLYYSEESRTTACRSANPLPDEGKSGDSRKKIKSRAFTESAMILLSIFFLNKIE